ncbi:acyltransferase [Metabacillus lacus]|nr:acyltransferase [Metabacillus lacus]
MSTHTAAGPSKNNYLFEIHFLRALACLLVLGVHVSATNYAMNDDTYTSFTYFMNQIGRFGTPIFAVISGFLLFYQVKRKGFQPGKFIVSRVSKILIPFLIWSTAYLYLLAYYNPGREVNLLGEAGTILSGNAFYHLYFVAIVVQFYIIFPIIQRIFRTQTMMIAFAFISFMISYKLYGFDPSISGPVGEFLAGKSFMPVWIFYFAFGGLLAYFWEEISAFAVKRPFKMLLLALFISGLAVLEYTVNGYVSNRRLSNLINIPLLSISIVGIYSLISSTKIVKGFFILIGKYSMGIYLIHPMILYVMARELPQQYWDFTYVPAMFAAVLLIAVIFIAVFSLLPLSSFIIPVPKLKKPAAKKPEESQPEAEKLPA